MAQPTIPEVQNLPWPIPMQVDPLGKVTWPALDQGNPEITQMAADALALTIPSSLFDRQAVRMHAHALTCPSQLAAFCRPFFFRSSGFRSHLGFQVLVLFWLLVSSSDLSFRLLRLQVLGSQLHGMCLVCH